MAIPRDEALEFDLGRVEHGPAGAVRGGRLSRRRRNQICLATIMLGGLNLLAYTVVYGLLGGDAHNGGTRVVQRGNGPAVREYFVRGHHLHTLAGRESIVPRSTWIYSYLHSISIPVTSAAMIVCMLVLARPHILATMAGGRFSGSAFIVVFAGAVIVATGLIVALFTRDFFIELAGW